MFGWISSKSNPSIGTNFPCRGASGFLITCGTNFPLSRGNNIFSIGSGSTSRAVSVDSFFSLSTIWGNCVCFGDLPREDWGDLDRSLGTAETRLPSIGVLFAARPSPTPEGLRRGENSEIGSERGRSFCNSPGSASRWFSESESSEISRIWLFSSAWCPCKNGAPDAWEKSHGNVFRVELVCLLPGLVVRCDLPLFFSAIGPLVALVLIGFPFEWFRLEPLRICFWTLPFLGVDALCFLHSALRAHCILPRPRTTMGFRPRWMAGNYPCCFIKVFGT